MRRSATQRGFVFCSGRLLRHYVAMKMFVRDAEWERLVEGWKR